MGKQSLRELDKYISLIPRTHKIRTIMKEIDSYPELAQEHRIQDVISNDYYLQYGQVKDFLYSQPRENLIKFYLNINRYIQ